MSNNIATVATDAKRADIVGYVNAWIADTRKAVAGVNDTHAEHLYQVGLHIAEGTGILKGKTQGERSRSAGLTPMSGSRIASAQRLTFGVANRLGVPTDTGLTGAVLTAINSTSAKAVEEVLATVKSLGAVRAALAKIKQPADAKRNAAKAARPNDGNAKHGGTGDTSAASNGDKGDTATLAARISGVTESILAALKADNLTVADHAAIQALRLALDTVDAELAVSQVAA